MAIAMMAVTMPVIGLVSVAVVATSITPVVGTVLVMTRVAGLVPEKRPMAAEHEVVSLGVRLRAGTEQGRGNRRNQKISGSFHGDLHRS